MSKQAKKTVGTKRPLILTAATAINTAALSKKKKTASAVLAAPMLEQVVQTLLPNQSADAASAFRQQLLATNASTAARARYEQFVQSLDMTPQPGKFDTVTLGDVLHVVPAINVNKRKFSQLYNVDQRVADVYNNAQTAYKALQDKAEVRKIADYTKQKRALKAKPKPIADAGNANGEMAIAVADTTTGVAAGTAADVVAVAANDDAAEEKRARPQPTETLTVVEEPAAKPTALDSQAGATPAAADAM